MAYFEKQVELATEEESFTEVFCAECPAVRYFPATLTDPPEYYCPAEWDPADGGCERHDKYLKLLAMAGEMDELTCAV